MRGGQPTGESCDRNTKQSSSTLEGIVLTQDVLDPCSPSEEHFGGSCLFVVTGES